MDYYPTGTRVLTDVLYEEYGGWTGTSTAAQRNLAYLIAEGRMERHLLSFLTPTTVTGTYRLGMDPVLVLDHVRILNVGPVALLEGPADCNEEDYIRHPGIGRLISAKYGTLTLSKRTDVAVTGSSSGLVSYVEVPYTAGFSEGFIAGSPQMQHALVVTAQEALQEIIFPASSEGGPGAPGLTEWGRGRTREVRTTMSRSALGRTARAQFAADLVASFKIRRVRKLGQ